MSPADCGIGADLDRAQPQHRLHRYSMRNVQPAVAEFVPRAGIANEQAKILAGERQLGVELDDPAAVLRESEAGTGKPFAG